MPRLIDPALLVALMLLAAIAGGYTGALLRLPRVVGYLAGGVFLHFVLLNSPATLGRDGVSPESLAAATHQLQGLQSLALGLIMFSIGSVFEMKHVRNVGTRIIRISLLKLATVLGFVGIGCTLVALLTQTVPGPAAIVLGVLLGVVGLATAPGATLLVLREYEAKGHNADAILTMTAINNIVCIVLFHALFFIFASSGLIESSYGVGRWLWLDLLLTSVGSVALGIFLGFAFSVLYAKLTIADFMLIFLGVALVLGACRDVLSESFHLSFSFLLTYLFFGATFANITPDQDAFNNALRTIAGPIFALFFVLAGFELHLGALPSIGLLGATYIGLRTLGKTLGGWLGARWAHAPGEFVSYLGFGMLCQAGVAIGLAEFLYANWGSGGPGGFVPHPAAQAFKTIVLGSVVVFELIGPVALKRVVVAAGEVKAVTLLRRRRTPGNEEGSVTVRTWHALMRTFGLEHLARPRPLDALRVRHIMRSNVKVIPAAARFDEVLHFVEGSRHNHFPVVDEQGQYVGMIHFGDLRNIMYDPFVRELVTAHDLSRQDAPLTTPELALDDLFELFHSTHVDSLAVISNTESRAIIGIVEQRDLLLIMHRSQKDETSG